MLTRTTKIFRLKTVYEVIPQGVDSFRMGGRDMNARAYLSKFNFTGADQEKK